MKPVRAVKAVHLGLKSTGVKSTSMFTPEHGVGIHSGITLCAVFAFTIEPQQLHNMLSQAYHSCRLLPPAGPDS